jgi:hypothetical protein
VKEEKLVCALNLSSRKSPRSKISCPNFKGLKAR